MTQKEEFSLHMSRLDGGTQDGRGARKMLCNNWEIWGREILYRRVSPTEEER